MRAKNLILLLLAPLVFACGKKASETKPIRKDVTETVFASGVLEADGTYSLTAQTEGYLTQVNFSEGQLVKEGTVLAVVDNRENRFNTESAMALYKISRQNFSTTAPALLQAKNSVMIARNNLRQDSTQYSRYKKLYEGQSVSLLELEKAQLSYETSLGNYLNAQESYRLQWQQAEQSVISNRAVKEVNQTQFGNNEIRAVVSGKVYDKLKERGDFVRKGDIIAVIGDANFLYAKVNVDESNITKIKKGQQALIQLNTDKSKLYKGIVGEIYPSFDEDTQSFYCKLFFTDTLKFRISGTQLQTNIVTGFQKNALLIPRNYLNFDGTVNVRGVSDPVKVETRFVSTTWVHVVRGLNDSSVIWTENVAGNSLETSEVGASMTP
jgi:HlyD family secretion protein